MKKIFTLFALCLILMSVYTYTQNNTQRPKIDPEFEKFWWEFQAAIVKGDVQKVIEMTNFPLLYSEDFFSVEGKIYPNNKNGFKKVFKEKFSREIVDGFKSIKNLVSGKIKGYSYEFKPVTKDDGIGGNVLNELKSSVGYSMRFFYIDEPTEEDLENEDYMSGNFVDEYYFIKIKGKYKFCCNFRAG